MAQEKLVVTVSEAAALTSVGRSTGYALVAKGEWPSITIGRSVRVPVEALRAWVERRMRATDPASVAARAAAHESATTDADRASGSRCEPWRSTSSALNRGVRGRSAPSGGRSA